MKKLLIASMVLACAGPAIASGPTESLGRSSNAHTPIGFTNGMECWTTNGIGNFVRRGIYHAKHCADY
jgi:hypothetical protein